MTPILPAVHTKPTKLALLFSGSILALSMTAAVAAVMARIVAIPKMSALPRL
ncbi:hypothetical protein [Psychrobacter cibarius]|uniref:hypothetical protein n=1 Tax=Psychrobacter cibarius TaxID=282669 RepID=UPI001917C4B8|nr:hypothetical protein [Psychrobacter cibarius]